jgi:AGZA family xanthine/uracil permease-like MFS transporter
MLFVAVPKSLRAAITIGIGFFITIIGLKIGQITRVTLADFGLANAIPLGNCVFAPDGSVEFCANSVDLDFAGYEIGIAHFQENQTARIAVLGLVFVSGLECLNIPGSIIIAIILTTFVGINYMNCGTVADGSAIGCVTDLSIWTQPGGPVFPVNVKDIPSGRLTFRYAHTPFFWQSVWTFLFVELFDSFGTLTGIMTRCGFMNGDPKKDMARFNRAMIVNGCGLWLGAIIGGNSITSFVESNTGIEAGARTGLASTFTGMPVLSIGSHSWL